MTTTYTLINDTTAQSWNYDSEPQLKTAARLYAVQHPTAALSVSIGGRVFKIR